MAISEGKRGAIIMAGCGKVDPAHDARLRDDKAGIIDAVFVLVDKHEGIDGGRVADLMVKMPASGIAGIGFVIHVCAHRDATEAGKPAEISDGGSVGRAFIDSDGAVIAVEHAVGDVPGVTICPGIADNPGVAGSAPSRAAAS